MTIKMFRFNIIPIAMLIFMASCVKDGMPPDCKKPNKPTVNTSGFTVNEGDTIRFTASGASSGGQYVWSGPDGFYSESANPQINFATIANGGTYSVKILVGYCYSDSVSINVKVKGDTTCNLGDNFAIFPNGSGGAFAMTPSCSIVTGGYYLINAHNADSSMSVIIKTNQKPTQAGLYTITSNPNPDNGQVFYQLTDVNGVHYINTTHAPAYVKVVNGKISFVICQIKFENIGIFSANISCH